MRVLNALVRLSPAAFRARFEQSMRYALERDASAAKARGRVAFATFWLTTCVELLWLAVRERAPRLGTMRPSFTVDWRDAWRAMRATPLVTTIAVVSLGLGIGANTALFTVLNSLSLKPLPVHDPDRLVYVDDGGWTNPIWEELRARHASFLDGAFAWSPGQFDLATNGEMNPVDGFYASGSTFRVLGVQPFRGRLFDERDDVHGGGPAGAVAVISHSFWQQRFVGAEDVLGRTINIERVPFTIIGITPPGFFGPDVGRSASVMIPIATEKLIRGAESGLTSRLNWWLEIMLRMRPGQTIEEATAQLHAIQPQIRAATLPPGLSQEELEGYLNEPMPLVHGMAGRSPLRTRFLQPLTTVLVVVALVLLIACANIASLLLARAAARRHELSVRLALGASRMRVARQLLAESFLLAAGGAALGLLLAHWGARALVAQLSTWNYQAHLDLAIDWRVLAFTAGTAAATAIIFGLAPAMGLSGVAPNEALKEKGRGVSGDRGAGLRNALVVAQVALSLALVAGAGLFTRTYVALATRDRGFSNDVLVVRANFAPDAVPMARRLDAFERMRAAAAAVPGVASAAVSYTTPISGRGWNDRIVTDGSIPNSRKRTAWVNIVSPGWFDTLGMKIVEGRDFDERDRLGAPLVAIVTRSFARTYFNTDHPIGREFSLIGENQTLIPYQVIGLAEDSVYRSLRSDMSPTMFRPTTQWDNPMSSVSISVRATVGPPLALTRAVGAAVLREESQAKLSFNSLSDQIGASLTQERLVARLSAFFGGLALVLAALGIYGVGAYAVNRRRREIGIRIALGADATGVVGLVLRRLGVLIAVGLTAGAAASLWAGKFVATLLYGLEPRDPATLAAAAAVLGIVGLLAGWIPARRASRIDPTVVLRES